MCLLQKNNLSRPVRGFFILLSKTLALQIALWHNLFMGSDAQNIQAKDNIMIVKATIEIDAKILKALVNNDLDTAQKHAINGELWRIAEQMGFVDDCGNPIN